MATPKPDGAAPAAKAQAAVFATTHWSVVLAAGQNNTPQASGALEKLCLNYWYPLYAYVRRRGYSPEDAQDLTQSFFERLLQKSYVREADRQRGRFRTFLLSALTHFLADEWDRSHRVKRGGGQLHLSLDAASAEERYRLEPVDKADAGILFERRWATTLLDRALNRLESEFSARGQAAQFAELNRFLLGDQGDSTYVESAPRLGLTPAAMKMAVSRMRSRCRELLREELGQTVASPEDAEEEYRALMSVLRR